MKKACSVVISLMLSLFIYVFYRSDATVVNELIVRLTSLNTYMLSKRTVADAIPIDGLIVFSLPGGLWVFCATALSRDFYLQVRSVRLPVVFAPVLFAIGLELLQLLQFVRGTFDTWDILLYFICWMLAYYPYQTYCSAQKMLTPFTMHGFMCLACFFSVFLAHVNY